MAVICGIMGIQILFKEQLWPTASLPLLISRRPSRKNITIIDLLNIEENNISIIGERELDY
ncbi:669_t:CDS:2 [Dentiscutata erythropus]|uniref:669_t:CDS:1 n=1 Tax=Dentiscutata erythropus TaxID=1348616 RepID=A0A9N9FNQ7_9GLOM|nr:669_t:CDS:2 [Dentiscutata erythropus]